MLKRVPRPSPGLVIATLALVASMAATAGALPGKNTVDSGDVKKNALTGKDIKESTLKLPAVAVAKGLDISVQTKSSNTVGQGGFSGDTVLCPAGKQAIAGGGFADQASTDGVLAASYPANANPFTPPGNGESFEGWRVGAYHNGVGGTITPAVYVVCVG